MKAIPLNECFDRTWLINLPSRPERRRHAVREMARMGMTLQAGRVEVFDAIRPDDAGGFPSVGTRGCFLSHLAVIRQAWDSGCDTVLILEDDVHFCVEWNRVASNVVKVVTTRQWDWLYLGHREPMAPSGEYLRPYDKGVATTHCYALKRRVMGRVIEYLEAVLGRPDGHPDGGRMHVDGAFSMFRARNADVVTLLAAPPLASQAGFASDIAVGRWFDRTPLVRSAVGALRWGRRRFKQEAGHS